jgi:RNA polymerase sigma-70 factor (ECF subfamily)
LVEAAVERTNEQWLADLRGSGRDQALSDLRALLVRGLRYGMATRSDVTESDLQDFAQDALLKILAGLDSFRGESRFTTWAQKIAIHVAYTELRRRHWKDVSLQDLLGQHDESDLTPAIGCSLSALADPTVLPEQQAAQRMVLDTLQCLIAEELTDRQRQALTAVMIGGMPMEEVAHRMGTNRNALYKLLYDARQRLQKRLIAEGLSSQDVLATFAS